MCAYSYYKMVHGSISSAFRAIGYSMITSMWNASGPFY